MRRLYHLDKDVLRIKCDEQVDRTELSWFHLFVKGEKKQIRTALIRLMWVFSTRGKAQLYSISVSGTPVHISYLIPACGKFPFLKKNDYEIGPCFTDENARGHGYYPKTLDFIISNLPKNAGEVYMIVADDNIPSQKGIAKAGFTQTGYMVERSRLGKHNTKKIQDGESAI